MGMKVFFLYIDLLSFKYMQNSGMVGSKGKSTFSVFGTSLVILVVFVLLHVPIYSV
jgi:hypothetical protein